MEITWLGHSCFRIKGKSGIVVTDPYDESAGYKLGKIAANVVTISHEHPRHNFAEGISGNPLVIRGPGEYEVAGIFIFGVTTYHDANKGSERGKNTCYLIEIDDIKVCHLGDLGHVPTAAQVNEISDAEVLLIPVGGLTTIDAPAAVETINLLSPKFVIPMHYKTDVCPIELAPLDKFLKEMGIKEIEPIPKLMVNPSGLPIDTQVVVLDYKQ